MPNNIEQSDAQKFDIVFEYIVGCRKIFYPKGTFSHSLNTDAWVAEFKKGVYVATKYIYSKANQVEERAIIKSQALTHWVEGNHIPIEYVDFYNSIKDKKWLKVIRK